MLEATVRKKGADRATRGKDAAARGLLKRRRQLKKPLILANQGLCFGGGF